MSTGPSRVIESISFKPRHYLDNIYQTKRLSTEGDIVNPHKGLIPEEVALKLFLDIVLYPVFPRLLLAYCVDVFLRWGLYVFCFVFFGFKAKINPQSFRNALFDILITSKEASTLAMF